MTAASTIDEREQPNTRKAGRRPNPLRSVPVVRVPGHATRRGSRKYAARSAGRLDDQRAAASPAAERQRAQLPSFAPLLEELEIAGWTSHRQILGGNFHDWMLLGGDRVMVTVGHAVGPEPLDPTVAALVAQSAWTAVRAHAAQSGDAGELLTLAAETLWPMPAAAVRAAVAVALIDTAGGRASVAMAGDCLAWRVRAATSEQIVIGQPLLGAATGFNYLGHSFRLSLRERLILAADNPHERSPKTAAAVGTSFSQLDAESHRRMTASEAAALVRQHYEPSAAAQPAVSASAAAVRRR